MASPRTFARNSRRGFTTTSEERHENKFSWHRSAVGAKARRAFTLIEMLVVMAIFIIVGGLGLVVSMDSYRSSGFYSDRNLLIATLQRARAEAIHNICLGTCTDGKTHGVKVLSNSYVIFQGSSYASRDTAVDASFAANSSFTHGGTLSEVRFAQLSGTTTDTGVISLSDQAGHTSDITVGGEGQITWTH